MVQTKIFNYFDVNTSSLHNQRFMGIISPGIYQGFTPILSSGSSNSIDLLPSSDGVSYALMPDGVLVKETGIVPSAFVIPMFTVTKDRWNLCYLTFNSHSNDYVYKVLQGVPADNPVKPSVPSGAIAVCYVYVFGTSLTGITQSDIFPVELESWTTLAEISSLKSVIDPTNSKRILVYPGVYPNKNSDTLIQFDGGYSEEVSDDGMADGDTRFVLFGLDDAGEIVYAVVSSKTTLAVPGSDIVPLSVGVFLKSGTVSFLSELVDVRTLFNRPRERSQELDSYLTTLSTTTYEYLRTDTFSGDTLLNSATVNPNYALKFDFGYSRLIITPKVWPLPADFEISTVDLVSGVLIVDIDNLMVLAESSVSDMSVDFSSSGVFFAGMDYGLGTKIPVNSVSSIFIKFKIPATNFSSLLDEVALYNYGVFFKSTPDSLDVYRQGDLSLPSVENLISNPFTICHQSAIDLTQTKLGPVGWQVVDGVLGGISLFPTILSLSSTPALRVHSAGTGLAGEYIQLEYRISASGLLSGQELTFGFQYANLTTVGSVSCGIRTYKYGSGGGTLVEKDFLSNAALPNRDTVLVTTTSMGSDVVAIGFVITIYYNVSGTMYLYNPQAMFGKHYKLGAVSRTDISRLLGVYERGRVVSTGSGLAGDLFSHSIQVSPKCTELGTVVVQRPSGSISRSTNITSTHFAVDDSTIIITGVPAQSGTFMLDEDYECYVDYVLVKE